MILDIKTTRYYLGCYGTDVSRWPEPEAGQTALAVYAKELGNELTQAKRLDTALEGVDAPAPSDLIKRRIMSALPAQSQSQNFDLPAYDAVTQRQFNWRAIAASLVVLGAVGFTTLSLQTPLGETAEEAEVWREAALDLGVDDVFDWVYSEDG